MIPEQSSIQSAFTKVKSGVAPLEFERQVVKNCFFDPTRQVDYSTVLTYALVFPKTMAGLRRYKSIFRRIRNDEPKTETIDDVGAAIVTAVCIYWNNPECWEQELTVTLQEWPWDDWGDLCIRSLSSYARLVFRTKSLNRLNFLKNFLLERVERADELELEIFFDAIGVAQTGTSHSYISTEPKESIRDIIHVASFSD